MDNRRGFVQLVLLSAVFIDLFAVALVVPNLSFRWKELGVPPGRLGAVQSVYSASQIIGGLVIGHLADGALGRKGALLLSFMGAGISYLLVGLAESIELLVLSRIIVGLVPLRHTRQSQANFLHSTPSLPMTPTYSGR